MGPPAAEQRESGSELQIEGLISSFGAAGGAQIGGGDVADLVAVVDVGGERGQQGVDGLDGGGAALLAHEVEAGEGAGEGGAVVGEVDALLHRDVAPVRELDGAQQAGDAQEGRVVLVVDLQFVLIAIAIVIVFVIVIVIVIVIGIVIVIVIVTLFFLWKRNCYCNLVKHAKGVTIYD